MIVDDSAWSIVGGQTEARAQLSSTIINQHEPFDQGFNRQYSQQRHCHIQYWRSMLGLKVSTTFGWIFPIDSWTVFGICGGEKIC